MCTAGSWELKYRVTSLSTADFAGISPRNSTSVTAPCPLNRKAGPSTAVLGFDCLIFS